MPSDSQKHKQHATISIPMFYRLLHTAASRITYDVLGWMGTGFIIGSYALLSVGIISGNSYVYHAMVLFGSLGVAAISYMRRAYQPFVINAFFVVIALIALIRLSYFF